MLPLILLKAKVPSRVFLGPLGTSPAHPTFGQKRTSRDVPVERSGDVPGTLNFCRDGYVFIQRRNIASNVVSAKHQSLH